MTITLATLAGATAQEVFDHVVGHLAGQKKQCKLEGSCLYQDGSGNKCAAGSLIAVGEYRGEFEGIDWASLVSGGIVPNAHEDLIQNLQIIHDANSPEKWPEILEIFALVRDLTFDRAKYMPEGWLNGEKKV